MSKKGCRTCIEHKLRRPSRCDGCKGPLGVPHEHLWVLSTPVSSVHEVLTICLRCADLK